MGIHGDSWEIFVLEILELGIDGLEIVEHPAAIHDFGLFGLEIYDLGIFGLQGSVLAIFHMKGVQGC